MKIIFMGTPEFAVPVLETLYNSNNQLIAVYTKPPKSANRGKKICKSPVHIKAEQLNIPVFTPNSFKYETNVTELSSFKPDIIIVAGYGLILRQVVLDIPRYCCLNIHPSSLPRWRGASPVERTIEAGDTETAVCIMKMDSGLDTGDILLRENISLKGNEKASELCKNLFIQGTELIVKNIDNIKDLKATPQSKEGITYAKKIEKYEGRINWKLSAAKIERKIRAFDRWPNCWFNYKGEDIKIMHGEVHSTNSTQKPGTVLDEDLNIQTGYGQLKPILLQRPGKKPVNLKDFLNGFKIPVGTVLT